MSFRESVTELAQHSGNGHDGILVVLSDLAVKREPGLGLGQRLQPDPILPLNVTSTSTDLSDGKRGWDMPPSC